MRVLLDACVPRQLGREIAGHEVRTAVEMGWGGLDDGPLLLAMTGRFDVLVTVDQRLRHQQRLSGRPFGVIVLRAKTNRLADLAPLLLELLAALRVLRPGEVVELVSS